MIEPGTPPRVTLIDGPQFPPVALVIVRGRRYDSTTGLTLDELRREQTDPMTRLAEREGPQRAPRDTGFRVVLPVP